MQQAEFPKIDPDSVPDGNRDPDFYSGPNAISTDLKGYVKEIVSTTPTHTTVKYVTKPLDWQDKLFGSKVDTFLALAPGTISDSNRDKALQFIIECLRGIASTKLD